MAYVDAVLFDITSYLGTTTTSHLEFQYPDLRVYGKEAKTLNLDDVIIDSFKFFENRIEWQYSGLYVYRPAKKFSLTGAVYDEDDTAGLMFLGGVDSPIAVEGNRFQDIGFMDGLMLLGRDDAVLKAHRAERMVREESDLIVLIGDLSEASLSYTEFIKTYQPDSLWMLNEAVGPTAVDEMGVQDGTGINGVTFGNTDVPGGHIGYSISLDESSSQYVNIPDNSNHRGKTNFLMEAWFKMDTIGADRYFILAKWGSGSNEDDFYSMEIDNDGDTNAFRCVISNGSYALDDCKVQNAVSAGVWTHGVFVKRDNNYRMYINGSLIYDQNGNSGVMNNNTGTSLRFGVTEHNSFFFNGKIYMVALYSGYNVPTSDTELDNWVSQHYNWS